MKSVTVLENRIENLKLNQEQINSYAKLNELIWRYRQEYTLQNLLSGYEQVELQSDFLELLSSSQKGTDFWLVTSGFQLTLEKAHELKQAGLVGVSIDLNHFEPDKHNDLQGYKHSYGWVLKAVENIRKAKLLLCVRLCPTPEFISMHNLFTYARMARKLGVSFIQIIEPGAKGNYQGKHHKLKPEQIFILDEFIETINFNIDFQNWPVVNLQSSLQYAYGTAATNEKGSFFVDPQGKFHTASSNDNK